MFAYKTKENNAVLRDGIEFTSKYWEQIKEYHINEIVVLASLEKECGKRSKKVQYVPASWVTDGNNDRELYIYLNSLTSETSIELKINNIKKGTLFPCEKLKGARSSGYNSVCLVKLGDDKNNIKKIRILRTEPGEKYRPKLFRLYVQGDEQK